MIVLALKSKKRYSLQNKNLHLETTLKDSHTNADRNLNNLTFQKQSMIDDILKLRNNVY